MAPPSLKTLTPQELQQFKVPGPRGFFSEELGGLFDEEAELVGILLRDKTDNDFGFVVLSKDHSGRWDAVDVGASLATQAEADSAMRKALERNRKSKSA